MNDAAGSVAGEAVPRFEMQRRAHSIVAVAMHDGTLKQEPCELCGDPKAVAHHDDYSRPLDVRWLCRSHHTLVHNALNDERDQSSDGVMAVPHGQMITARKFRDGMAAIVEPVTVVRLVDGEYVKLGLWIPARRIDAAG